MTKSLEIQPIAAQGKWRLNRVFHRGASRRNLTLERLEDRLAMSAVGFEAPTTAGAAKAPAILPNLPANPSLVASTVPHNGDVNPYGVVFVPSGFASGGKVQPGDILVSNFNNSQNLQGTGSTIVSIAPNGHQSLFFQGNGNLGLTTALGVLKNGFVIVGNVPTLDGSPGTLQPTSLIFLDKNGHEVLSLQDNMHLDGPWDLTVNDQGNFAQLFVSNVLDGTVTRIDLVDLPNGKLFVLDKVQIASGYTHRTDPAALFVGPTGVAFDAQKDVLYVASTGDNAIYAIPNAAITFSSHGKGQLIYQDAQHLHGPLSLVLAPNGDLITANGDAVNPNPNDQSSLVEFTPTGHFVAEFSFEPQVAGAAFGIAVTEVDNKILFAAVDDALNQLDVWTIKLKH